MKKLLEVLSKSKKAIVEFMTKNKPKSNKEVLELMEDMKSQGYTDIVEHKISEDVVSVTGKIDRNDFSAVLNFADNSMTQTTVGRSHIMTPFLPCQEVTTTVRGTIDDKIHTVCNINHRFSDSGNYRTETILSNYVTKNDYKRIATPSGKEYYKKINDNWTRLFT